MTTWRREVINPVEALKAYFDAELPEHVTFNPDMKWSDRQYFRVAAESNDGTLSLSANCLARCIEPLIKMESYYKPTFPVNARNLIGIKYTIGMVYHAVVYGQVKLGCGECQGQRESYRIPVICEYVYGEEK